MTRADDLTLVWMLGGVGITLALSHLEGRKYQLPWWVWFGCFALWSALMVLAFVTGP
jgi:hypothetical protein